MSRNSGYGSPQGYGNGTPNQGLFSGNRDYMNDDIGVLAADQRSRLLMGNSRVDDHTDRLAHAHRIAAETEEIGIEISNTLGEQTKTLQGARDKVRHINEDMDTTRKLLFGMFRRMITNKIIIILMILLMLVGIGVIIYLKWGRNIISKQ
eukprot:TRINITY_DN2672_c0_g1_i1.p1 TRINITY_DN2672_c0_g1~~TRINITY_DN2672_c0_g1_i1.p1  ORF type:complete len:150 (-),score=21.52 TRINITY_DN2672_c0_g1_i1:51-500(-)